MRNTANREKRAALYVRVSTDQQTVAQQLEALRAVAERRGWQIVETYTDAGISGVETSARALMPCSGTRAGGALTSQWPGLSTGSVAR